MNNKFQVTLIKNYILIQITICRTFFVYEGEI